MRLMRSIIRTFAFAGICLLVWLTINISGLVISEQANSNIAYVPSNATFAMRIDGRELAENTLFSIVLESKDESILKLFEESLTKRTSGDKKLTNTGINFLSDVVLFKVNFQGEEIDGILFNLLSRSTFLKNMPDLINSTQAIAANDEVGILLSCKQKKAKCHDLEVFAKQLLKSKNKNHHKIFHAGSAPNRFSEIHFHTGDDQRLENEVNLIFEQSEKAFLLKGSMQASSAIEMNQLSHELKPDGFHVTSKLFSKTWSDTLRKSLSFLSPNFPEITAFSMNYRGVSVINHSSGFLAIPDAEFVIHCAENFDVSAFLHEPELSGKMDCELTDNFIRFEEEVLYFRQLSPKSFYLGKNPNPVFESANNDELFTVEGDLNPLTNIKGGGMMTAFLEMVPLFKASKNLAKNSQKIQFSINKVSDKKAKIKGELIFKTGHYPLSEVMRFLLSGKLIE